MFAIRIESKKESFMYAIALGGVLFLIIGVTWIYWTHSSNRLMEKAALTEQSRESASEGQRTFMKQYDFKPNGTSSLWFFGTLVVSLLLLFGLTFRYYSYREMKEVEKRWSAACQSFLTRIEIEKSNFEEDRMSNDTVWLRILKGEPVEEAEMVRFLGRKQENIQLV